MIADRNEQDPLIVKHSFTEKPIETLSFYQWIHAENIYFTNFNFELPKVIYFYPSDFS